ncbi:MAG: hypothetical protein Q8P85_12380 [Pseudomonas sp.]|nr:hypothetical protein [Pseudomonas sp.]
MHSLNPYESGMPRDAANSQALRGCENIERNAAAGVFGDPVSLAAGSAPWFSGAA